MHRHRNAAAAAAAAGGVQLGAVRPERSRGIAAELVDSFPTHEYKKPFQSAASSQAALGPAGVPLQVALRRAPPPHSPPPRLTACAKVLLTYLRAYSCWLGKTGFL